MVSRAYDALAKQEDDITIPRCIDGNQLAGRATTVRQNTDSIQRQRRKLLKAMHATFIGVAYGLACSSTSTIPAWGRSLRRWSQ